MDRTISEMTEEAPKAPSGTVTFLFTDIEGSTRLLERLREHYAAVLVEQRDLLRSAFARWHGHEIDTQGDSFFVAFGRATDAVLCATDAQRELDEILEVASALHKLGQVVLHAGDNAQATQLFRESLEFQYRHDNRQGIIECLAALAGAAVGNLQWERAAVLFGAATALLDRLGAPMAPADLAVWQEQEAAGRQQTDPEGWTAAWAIGRRMSSDEAVDYALGSANSKPVGTSNR